LSGFVGGVTKATRWSPLGSVPRQAICPRALMKNASLRCSRVGAMRLLRLYACPFCQSMALTLSPADRAFLLDPADAELFLSPHTIKSQMRSIYRKRGTSSRSQAVARARELRLLEGKTLCSCGAYGPSQTWRARLNDGDL